MGEKKGKSSEAGKKLKWGTRWVLTGHGRLLLRTGNHWRISNLIGFEFCKTHLLSVGTVLLNSRIPEAPTFNQSPPPEEQKMFTGFLAGD